jgi:fructose-specific phosphotransferase system component IIB
MKIALTTLAVGAVTAGWVGLAAPVMAAPNGTATAQDTISALEEQGYRVVVNRLSTSPLDEANVVSVGEGPSFTHSVTGANTDGDKLYGPVTTTTVYVNVR